MIGGETETMEVSEDYVITWLTAVQPVDIRRRANLTRIIRLITRWLHMNGGTILAVQEIEL